MYIFFNRTIYETQRKKKNVEEDAKKFDGILTMKYSAGILPIEL